MKKLLAVLFAAVIFITSCATPVKSAVNPCETAWIGSTDLFMLMKVREDVAKAKEAACETLFVELLSPGGPVVTSIEISQVIRRARKDINIEIHARSFIASGATVVVSAGTKSKRYITQNAFVLVHGPQSEDGCKAYTSAPKNDNEKALNQFIVQLAQEYSINTGKPFAETLKWLACDNTQIGDENLAIKLGLVDHIED